MKKRISLFLVAALVILTTACSNSGNNPNSGTSQPQQSGDTTWKPTGDVTIFCPYAAGGATDLSLRCLAEVLSDQLSVNVNVVNREGGGGVVGTTQFMTEKADGYSIAMISNSQFSTQPFLRDVEYTIDDFIPFIGLNLEPNLLIVPADAPYDTLDELIAYYKNNDETITYGHSGNGGIGHLTQTFFLQEAGLTNSQSIPYSGNSEAITALLGKHITMCTANYVEATGLLENNSVKALALIASERSTFDRFKDIPTLKELGIEVDLTIFKFLALPGGASEEVESFWFNAVTEAYQDEQWQTFVTGYNLEVCGDWDKEYLLNKLLPEIESTHEMLKTAGLAVK